MSQNEKNLSIRQDENKTDENIVSENDSCHDVEVSDTYLTWTDTFVMKKLLLFVQQGHILWKGLSWNLKLMVDESNLSIYVGYDDVPVHERCNLPLSLSFRFELLNEGDEVICSTDMMTHAFSLSECAQDRGTNAAFGHDFLKHLPDCCRRQHELVFRIRVTLIENFASRGISRMYNSKESTGFVGLQNLGATCYLNSLLQMLFHINSFRKAVYLLPPGDAGSIVFELQNLFRNLQTSSTEVNTMGLIASFNWTSADAFVQQDVQEILRILLDKLEGFMKNTSVDGYIKKLFCGTTRSFIKCVNVDYESKREEEFYDIQLDVKGCKNIYESFKKYVETEMLDGENKYDANEHGKQDAEKGVIFTKFPPVLTLLLKRFEFSCDYMRYIKIHDSFEFPIQLDLDNFLAADATVKTENKYQLHSVLVHVGDVEGGHYYAFIRPSSCYCYSEKHGILNPIFQPSVTLADVLKYWKAEARTSDSLSIQEKCFYDGRWFKFNDETVHEVREYEATRNCYGRSSNDKRMILGSGSAYMLVYVRDAEAEEVMGPVRNDDIPSDLDQKLNEEIERQRLLSFRSEIQSLMQHHFYAFEEDLSKFSAYTRSQDLIDKKNLPYVESFGDCSVLFLWWKLSRMQNITPRRLRLWTIGVPNGKKNVLRVLSSLGPDAFTDKIEDDERYFVEILPEPVVLDEKALAIIHDFDEKCTSLRRQEDALIANVAQALLKIFHGDTLDIVDKSNLSIKGCGIGGGCERILSFLPIEDRQEHFEIISKIEREILILMNNYCELDISPCDSYVLSDTSLLAFFKLYDPYHIFFPVVNDMNMASNYLPSLWNENIDKNNVKLTPENMEAIDRFRQKENSSSALGNNAYFPTDDSLLDCFTEIATNMSAIKYLEMTCIDIPVSVEDIFRVTIEMLERVCGSNIPSEAWRRLISSIKISISFSSLHTGQIFDLNVEDRSTQIAQLLARNRDEEVEMDASCAAWQEEIKLSKDCCPVFIIEFEDSILRDLWRSMLLTPLSTASNTLDQLLSHYCPARSCDWIKSLIARKQVQILPFSPIDETLVGRLLSLSDSSLVFNASHFICQFSLDTKLSIIFQLIARAIGLKSTNQLVLYLCWEWDGAPAFLRCRPIIDDKMITLDDALNGKQKMNFNVGTGNLKILYHLLPFQLIVERPQKVTERIVTIDEEVADVESFVTKIVCTDQRTSSRFFEVYLVNRDYRNTLDHIWMTNSHDNESFVSRRDNVVTSLNSNLEKTKSDEDFDDLGSGEKRGLETMSHLASPLKRTRYEADDVENHSGDDTTEIIDVHIHGKHYLASSRLNTVGHVCKEIWSSINTSSNYSYVAEMKSPDSGVEKKPEFINDIVSVSMESDDDLALVLLEYRNSIVYSVLQHWSTIDSLPPSWIEATSSLNSCSSLGFQCLLKSDLPFYRGIASIPSMCVGVVNFTLLGNASKICDIDDFGPPFLSFIRQDDTIETLIERWKDFVELEDNISKCKIAVISDRIALFLDSLVEEKSPWALISKAYPHFVNTSFCEIMSSNDSVGSITGSRSNQINGTAKPFLPLVGIQRSVSDIGRLFRKNLSHVALHRK